MDWDVFISHASEDRATVARPLAERLRARGVRVWLDEQELTLGDSLRRKIDIGLARSRWGVVVLSPDFLSKEWPQAELDALLSRELNGAKVLLPVWHQVSAAELADRSPLVAARLGIDTKHGMDAVCDAVMKATTHESMTQVGPSPKPTGLLWAWTAASTAARDPFEVREVLSRPELYEGALIGDYVLLSAIGSGGSGAVFRASHRLLGLQVALKLFFPAGSRDRSLMRATERAVRGLATLRHPNIAALHDFGCIDLDDRSCVYLVNELVRGSNLADWNDRILPGESAFNRRLGVAAALTDALHVAHTCNYVGDLGFRETGILHGDVKPSNILIRRNGSPVVVDFMIPDLQRLVAMRQGTYWEKRADGRYHYNLPLTAAYGTPGYMPPEQELEGIVTPTSDVYALGRTLQQLFWRGEMNFHRAASYDTENSADGRLVDLVDRMTQAQPESRPQSMLEVADMLRAIGRQERT